MEMSLQEKLEATPVLIPPAQRRQEHPNGFSYEWDGNAGVIDTGPLGERPKSWDAFIRDSGLDPEEIEVIEPVQVRAWDAPAGAGSVVRMHYYRLTVRRRMLQKNLDEIIKAARYRVRSTPKPTEAAQGFLVALGDIQIGKADGDGVEGTVERFVRCTDIALDRYKVLRKAGKVGPVYLTHLGDCIEGFTSQGGNQAWRTTLTTTEQFRLYRRLLVEQVKAFATVTDKLVVCGIPGNHDEAYRPLQTYGDSWAIEAISTVRDALKEVKGYDHVTMFAPARDELTLTLDMCGTVVGLAHGHQWRRPEMTDKWWAGQSHGRQPIGDADLLLSGHFHHLRVVETGAKTWIQVPALESESTWWRHRSGQVSRPGFVTAIVGGGKWSGLEIV